MEIFSNQFSSLNEESKQGPIDSPAMVQLKKVEMKGTHGQDRNPDKKMETYS